MTMVTAPTRVTMQSIKCVAVGDAGVGKTCVLTSFASNGFPQVYTPTVFDNYSANLIVDGCTVSLSLCDNAGHGDYDTLRPLSYPQTDVFLVCFSVDSPRSLSSVSTKWATEIACYSPGTPIVLAGLKADLRTSKLEARKELVPASDGIAKAREIGAAKYAEASAITAQGLRELFNEVVRAAMARKAPCHRPQACTSPMKSPKRNQQCSLM
eukprot:m51a1_g499 putative ras-related c3 botulinum toxin substrate 1 (rho small gtp binding protein rac1) (211) ;mRNA; f:264578-265210